jgi:hypothetical protein
MSKFHYFSQSYYFGYKCFINRQYVEKYVKTGKNFEPFLGQNYLKSKRRGPRNELPSEKTVFIPL